jgi:hypothetical protein
MLATGELPLDGWVQARASCPNEKNGWRHTIMSSEQYFRGRREARFQGAWAFLDGNIFDKSNITTDGRAIYSYGRHFPMAIKFKAGIRVNEDRYSVTTSKHQGALRTVLSVSGYEPTDVLTEYQGHTMRLWIRD